MVLASLAALVPAVWAEPLGALRSVQSVELAGHEAAWDLRTENRALLRVSLLRPDLLRIQAGAGGVLAPTEDKAAAIVVGRYDEGAVEHRFVDAGDHLLIQTAALSLRIDKKPLRFTLYRAGDDAPLWQETQPIDIGDKRSVQTLSSSKAERFFGGGQQNGRFEFKGRQLEISYSGGWDEGDRPSPAPVLLSSRGWGMLRNSWRDGSYDLRQDEQITLAHDDPRFDAYFFVGPTLHELLARYTELTGRARMLPRWALGYGDADCYNDGDNASKPGTVPRGWSDGPTGKTPDVIDSVAKQYRVHDMPGAWILPNDGYGCGYTDLPKVVLGLKQYGFRTGLWTESGVDKIAWEVGTAGTRVQKLDVAWTGKGYQFSMDANKAAYDGILNNSDSRPFLWTVMGWAGIQRYAVAWTGDQNSSWDYIRWHIPTLIGSGLSGMAYASGDVDAIFGGSPETFTRDLQWKAFTPVLMGMSGWSSAARKHPWWYEEPYRSINRDYLLLKMRLTPYMVGLAREAEQTGAPLVRGLMWDFPQDPKAFGEAWKNQFLLGRELLVAPVFRSQAASQGWRRGIHLPEGRWIDYWDGRQLHNGQAGRQIDRAVTLDKLPVFVRAGAILPMYPGMLFDGEKPVDQLELDLYPQGESGYTLYEDDGNTQQYRQGRFSEQRIAVSAPPDGVSSGPVRVSIDPARGEYAGQELQRSYALRVLARQRPTRVDWNGQALPQWQDKAAYDAAALGWMFDPGDRQGTLHVKTVKLSIRQAQVFTLGFPASQAAPDDDFPAAPVAGREIPGDSLVILNRPAEEPGSPLENALDGKPETWFRTTRSPLMKTGPHEWTLGLGERRLIDGIDLAPRTDAHWKYGQIRDYEVYVGDNNGDWGRPIKVGRLKLQQGMQRIDFDKPVAARLLRFRVLSTHNPEGDDAAGTDPMVTAAASPAAKAFDAAVPADVGPVTLSEFHVLEHRRAEDDAAELQRYLSDLPGLPRAVAQDRPVGGKALRMNGLLFRKGLGVGPASRVDLKLAGDWRLLRADLGVDDACRKASGDGGLRFQVWGDGRLLYDSGLVKAPAVVKPEIDLRGLERLSLRTLGATSARVCGNWANAALIGYAGDAAEIAP